jgi:hypothetical protein
MALAVKSSRAAARRWPIESGPFRQACLVLRADSWKEIEAPPHLAQHGLGSARPMKTPHRSASHLVRTAGFSNTKFNGVGGLQTYLTLHVRVRVNHGGLPRVVDRFRIVRGLGPACRSICATSRVVRATRRLARNGTCADQWYSARPGKCWWNEQCVGRPEPRGLLAKAA